MVIYIYTSILKNNPIVLFKTTFVFKTYFERKKKKEGVRGVMVILNITRDVFYKTVGLSYIKPMYYYI